MELEYVVEWIRFADTDLATAEFLQGMHPQPLEIICYHCQQSAEKYLKGYLIYKGIEEPPKIHDLDTLSEMCLSFDSRFSSIDKACSVLTLYGIQPRYPNEIEVNENDMLRAIEYAREVRGCAPLADLRKIIGQ